MLRMAKTPPKGYEDRTRLAIVERPAPIYTLAVAPADAPKPFSRELRALGADAAPRVLELQQGNLFDCTDAWDADILICETNIDVSMQYNFLHFLSRCKAGCRLLTYNSLEYMMEDVCARIAGGATATNIERKSGERMVKPLFPWKRLDINTPVSHQLDTLRWGSSPKRYSKC